MFVVSCSKIQISFLLLAILFHVDPMKFNLNMKNAVLSGKLCPSIFVTSCV